MKVTDQTADSWDTTDTPTPGHPESRTRATGAPTADTDTRTDGHGQADKDRVVWRPSEDTCRSNYLGNTERIPADPGELVVPSHRAGWSRDGTGRGVARMIRVGGIGSEIVLA